MLRTLLLFCAILLTTIGFSQVEFGQRLVTPFNMALGVNDDGVKEKVIHFEVPFQNKEIFSTLAIKFFNTHKNTLALEIAYAQESGAFTDWEALKFDHHVKSSAGFIVTDLTYIDVQYDRLKIRVSTREVGNFRAEAHWFLPDLNYSFEKKPLPIPMAIGAIGTSFDAQRANCDLPQYVTRTGWNCPDGQAYSGGTPTFHNVSHLVVHHSAGSNTSSNWAASVLSIWNYHTTTAGYADIAYNILVDPNGIIYEGRGGNQNYTQDVLSGATCGSNSGSMSVCILGNYELVTPTAELLESLQNILAWKAEDKNIDPVGSSNLNNYGVLDHIFGHRQGCTTACPGQNLYDELPNIRLNVDDLINNGCNSGSPNLETVSYLIDDDNLQDSNGDNDGLVDGGEVVEIYLEVINNGDGAADNVIVSIATDESCVTIDDDDFSFGTLAVGQDSIDGDFDLTISESCIDQDVEFYLTYTSDQGIWEDTIVIHIYNPCNLPVVDFSANPLSGIAPLNVSISNGTTNAQSYLWNITGPEDLEFTSESPSFELAIPGIYSVLLTAYNECGSNQLVINDYIVVEEATSIFENELIANIYPNPVKRRLNIEFERVIQSGEIVIVNMAGQQVFETHFSGRMTQLNVRNLAAGQYVLRLVDYDNIQQVVSYPFIKGN